MASPKRISIKGRGADIFFGDYTPPPPPAPPSAPPGEAVEPDAAPTPIQPAQGQPVPPATGESPPARQRAGGPASRPVDQPARGGAAPLPASPLGAEVLNGIAASLAERATITNAFRYTDQELAWLTDVLYEITKRHKVKLTKQDIARLGLNAVLWDWRERGDASLLGEFVRKRKAQRASM